MGGKVLFARDYVGRFASVTFPAGVNSAIVSADYPLNSESTPGGAGVYPFVANFLSYSPNYASALSASTSLTVLREGATAAFTAPSYVSDRAFPALAVTVDQRDPGGDTQYIDYGVVATWARFDVYAPGKAVPQQTGYAQLKNAANWSTTGLGTAQLVLAKPLADGVYEVVAGIVANSTSAQGNSSTYLATDTARAYLTSAPSTGIFAAGAGYIATDSTSNIGSRRGQFGFFGKPGKTPTGVVAYTYRMRMDIGGGTLRDVDVEVTSTSITTLTLKSAGTGGTVLVRGAFAVRYLDAVTLADYTTFDFSGGTYELNSTDAGTSGDRYQLLLKRPDGTAFHSSSSSQLPVAGGGITVKSSE